jgi:YD repeat-containing protein
MPGRSDAKGYQTDYTYNSTTGQLLTATLPAATSGGTRPKTTYAYSSKRAYYKNSAGLIVASSQPTSLLTSISTCQTSASCVDAADEARTVIDYGPQTAGTANNLLPRSITNRNGTNTLSATTALAYDDVGNLISVDGPLSGTADTTFYRYDAVRQNVGVISPDPDGASSLKRRAQRFTYNMDGQVTKVEQGTVDGTSDANWAAFSSLQQLTSTYDGKARKTKEALTAGGSTFGVTQYSYDAISRIDCVAQRMNSAAWGSQTANCTPDTAGANGPDRITKYSYDAVGRVNKVQTAFGISGVQADAVTNTYTGNGLVKSVKDAAANLTTYEYDGFDRLSKTRYPSTTKGAGTSSTADYTQNLYDENSNVTEVRLRGYSSDSTKKILFAYDRLNRMTLKTLLGSELNVNYSYDLLGRMTSASQSGNALSFTYDALGRNLTQVGPQGTVNYEYDAAGRRTKMTWPGSPSLYVNYDYLVTGEVTKIRENGASSGIGVLASYSLDNLGFRTGIDLPPSEWSIDYMIVWITKGTTNAEIRCFHLSESRNADGLP